MKEKSELVKSIPKYVATRQAHDESVRSYGTGDTPEQALEDFSRPGGPLADDAGLEGIPVGEEIEVEVWTGVDPRDSCWDADDIEANEWTWVCGSLDRTVMIAVPPTTT